MVNEAAKRTAPAGPTKERLARAGEDIEMFTPAESDNYKTVRMLDGSPLDMLASRNVITGDQYNAGRQFYQDWYYSGLAASGVMDPCAVVVDGGLKNQESDARLDAATRWKRAVQALGLVHSNVLTSVVLHEEPMADYGRRRFGLNNEKQARLATRVSLINALDALDQHYYGRRTSRMGSSHRADYRPDIPPIDTSGTRE